MQPWAMVRNAFGAEFANNSVGRIAMILLSGLLRNKPQNALKMCLKQRGFLMGYIPNGDA